MAGLLAGLGRGLAALASRALGRLQELPWTKSRCLPIALKSRTFTTWIDHVPGERIAFDLEKHPQDTGLS